MSVECLHTQLCGGEGWVTRQFVRIVPSGPTGTRYIKIGDSRIDEVSYIVSVVGHREAMDGWDIDSFSIFGPVAEGITSVCCSPKGACGIVSDDEVGSVCTSVGNDDTSHGLIGGGHRYRGPG